MQNNISFKIKEKINVSFSIPQNNPKFFLITEFWPDTS